jgi:hypothetical protein
MALESVCLQNLAARWGDDPDLERQALAELRDRGVTVLPDPQERASARLPWPG